MSFLDRIIHNLDSQYSGIQYQENIVKEIKEYITILLNAKIDDCVSLNSLGMPDISFLNVDSSELCILMAKEIRNILQEYENRIRLLSISYDSSLSPWQLDFDILCCFTNDRFSEFNIHIIFRNNRYCEVL
ncbi:type VI secretion system baseplate subunit TssE [Helicobacter saguini]|uniref:Type VI secretion system baseplate subunit TssE n=1 Tax=Helicobacter saguini TaxID=1548018 RepID=A0A347VNY7_9HELI|nr:GPW/gp25 family protein [Helicobacter saguini]MWV61582.1 type VI secretion system baseplate subunit TssE [Helicobacter saguini]MWV67747.1 type VI secretion system baseplate subunit TssE [Helicobacter saguini]MWV70785.1 type VI secretion system baseplate subunit TssE [Helicobacter saguini]MWV72689.1 type VI secretion system baseplate subunit TssE [Helicobacter saguini]TLD94510.1 type VI secretion system baseplate subunit TssE [Helicobacter saguini]